MPIRLTENEYQELLDLAKESGCQDNLSKYIREILFASSKRKANYRELVIMIRKMRSEIHHTLLLYQKDFLTDAQVELEKCNDKLEELQKEVMNIGSYSIEKY